MTRSLEEWDDSKLLKFGGIFLKGEGKGLDYIKTKKSSVPQKKLAGRKMNQQRVNNSNLLRGKELYSLVRKALNQQGFYFLLFFGNLTE